MIWPLGTLRGPALAAVCLLAPIAGYSGQLTGTINATYQRSTRNATTDSAGAVVTPRTSTETKQSNILVSYHDLLFSKNLIRLGANYFIQRDELMERWNVRPIFNLDLSSAGYQYNGSYSPRKIPSSRPLNDTTFIETRTYIRDWRNSLTLSWRKLPVVNLTYNTTRYFDDKTVRTTDRKNRYITVQSAYVAGPASASVIYTNARNENRITSPRTRDNHRTWQATTGYTGSARGIGSVSASYSYLDARSNREALTLTPISTSHIHSVAAMVTSRDLYHLSSTVSYSGRFQIARSDDIRTTTSDENFSGQLAYAPLAFLSLSMTKNYQIASQAGRHRINENLAFSASFTRFLRRGLDTRLNWSRTYIQKTEGIEESSTDGVPTRVTSGSNYTDALYASIAATPYRRSKLLADLSISRANNPFVASQRYLSARSVSLSFSATRSIEGRLSATYTNQGQTLDLFRSFARSITAGATYVSRTNLNCNVSYTQNDINTSPRQSNGVISGFVGYSFRNAYTFYLQMNQQRQESPTAGSSIETTISKPRSLTAQLQVRTSPRSTVAVSYTKSSNAASDYVGGAHSWQVIYHGQF